MNTETKDEVVYLYLDDIIPNRFQPREVFDEKALKELAVSIKEHGVIQPIIVRRVNGKYEIIAGERRYKASALAGMTKIPAIIRDLDDKESSKVALLENLQRKNLNPIEEARTYQKILEIDQMTQEELAKTMGKSQSAVANKIRLLSLSDEVQDSLLKEQISERHARALLNISDAKKQKEMLKKVISNKMTVRTLEEEISKMNGTPSNENIQSARPSVEKNTSSIMSTMTMSASPTSNGQTSQEQKFINYGEIDTEEVEEPKNSYYNQVEVKPVDVNAIKENANDIIPANDTPSADLDNLLNIQAPASSKYPQIKLRPEQDYRTPAEAIVKGDEEAPNESIKDYFKIPNIKETDFSEGVNQVAAMPQQQTISSIMNNPNPVQKTGAYTTEEIMTKIRDVVKDIESHGNKITFDEMNFATAYQVIIKVDK